MKRHLLILCLLGSISVFSAVGPVSIQKIELKHGWNLVTLTRPVIEASQGTFLLFQPMTYNPVRKCYVRCTHKEELKIGVGYWVYVDNAQPLELINDLGQATWQTAALTRGWNLIGMTDNSSWQNQATIIWQWKDGKFKIITKEDLTVGQAYWVMY